MFFNKVSEIRAAFCHMFYTVEMARKVISIVWILKTAQRREYDDSLSRDNWPGGSLGLPCGFHGQ